MPAPRSIPENLTFMLHFSPGPDNDTYIAHIVNDSHSPDPEYDDIGAMCYILAIVFMYGCSILMMIASFVKKSDQDNTILTYMKDLERLGKLQLKQDKFRTTLQMHHKKVHRILGPDRAEVYDDAIQQPFQTPSPSSAGEDVFTWDPSCSLLDPERRPSALSIGTTMIFANDLLDLHIDETGKCGLREDLRRKSAPAGTQDFNKKTPVTRSITAPNTEYLEKQYQQQQEWVHQKPKNSSVVIDHTSVNITKVPEVRIHTCE